MMLSLRIGNEMTRDKEYLEKLLDAIGEYGKVFDEVWVPTSYACPSLETCRKITEEIKGALEIFEKRGIVPSIQVSRTVGHAPVKSDMEGVKNIKNYEKTIEGAIAHGGRICWNDEEFRKYIYEAMKIYAESKPSVVWVDDDMRVRRPKGGGTSFCFCDGCIEKYNRLYNHNFTFETIKEPFTNDVNIRKEYMEFQIKSLQELCEIVTKAFHEVSPETDMALQCGADISLATDTSKACLDVMKDISGKTPLYRVGGGFYDDHTPELLINKALKTNYAAARTPEYVETIASEIENLPFIAYGKTHDTPCIEAALFNAYGCNRATITLMDDAEDMENYKKGFKKLAMYKPYLEKAAEHNVGTKNGGVAIVQSEYAALSVGEETAKIWDNSAIYNAVKLTRLGIPFHSGPEGNAYLLTSQAVDGLIPEDIEKLLSLPVITDGASIEKLMKRGYADKMQVTARKIPEELKFGVIGTMTDHKVNEGLAHRHFANNWFYCQDDNYILEGKNLEPVMDNYAKKHLGGNFVGTESGIITTAYGAKWAIRGTNLTAGFLNKDMRDQFLNMINLISVQKMPAYLVTEDQVMVIPRINKEGKTVSVTLFNPSMGDYENLELVINNPANESECLVTYPYEADKKCKLEKSGDSFKVKIDSLERWRIKTILC